VVAAWLLSRRDDLRDRAGEAVVWGLAGRWQLFAVRG
jgi:hypothetical protein